MKKCTKCGEVKPLDSFSTEKRAKDGRRSACKTCLNISASKYYKDKDYVYSAEYRRRKTLACYGITPEDFNDMLEEQDNRCKICNIEERHAAKGRFHVDHCHDTGKVRGLLCSKCNQGLGMFNDNSQFLREAATYLEDAQ